jgi:hypothetical protein
MRHPFFGVFFVSLPKPYSSGKPGKINNLAPSCRQKYFLIKNAALSPTQTSEKHHD